jgi:hypothetical protein
MANTSTDDNTEAKNIPSSIIAFPEISGPTVVKLTLEIHKHSITGFKRKGVRTK